MYLDLLEILSSISETAALSARTNWQILIGIACNNEMAASPNIIVDGGSTAGRTDSNCIY